MILGVQEHVVNHDEKTQWVHSSPLGYSAREWQKSKLDAAAFEMTVVWSIRRWEVLSYAHLRELTDLANVTLLTFVAPDVHHKVHEHWHQFPVPHPLWHPVLGTLYAIIGLLALTGNGMVLWVFAMTRSLRSGTNLLTMNLALSDLLMMLTQFPVLISNCFHQSWTLGPLAYQKLLYFSLRPCPLPPAPQIYGFCGALFGTVSIITMALIAFDRYRAIVTPFAVPTQQEELILVPRNHQGGG
ncbi:rhodopsin-like [Penaeus indicus]|uniref:rhodopsin-like n=1 Tax=Penaeus indicus TaxID=29960 RepID=UPI00300C9AC9